MAFVILGLSFAVPLALGFFCLRMNLKGVVPVLALACVVAFVWLYVKAETAQGWDGLNYAIFAFLMVAPAFVGLLVGGLIALLLNRRSAKDKNIQ